jgi:hypothetical protein
MELESREQERQRTLRFQLGRDPTVLDVENEMAKGRVRQVPGPRVLPGRLVGSDSSWAARYRRRGAIDNGESFVEEDPLLRAEIQMTRWEASLKLVNQSP